MKSRFQQRVENIPLGYSEVKFQGRTYGLTRTDFAGGRSMKVYGEEQGGTDFISFNYYFTQKGDLLKPCEMPEAKVREFILGYESQ